MSNDSASAYETHARTFLENRDHSPIGAVVVSRWAAELPRGADVVELGCGGGYPITRALVSSGVSVWAIDSSPTLLDTFRSRFPRVPTACETVQTSRFFGRSFDAAVAVGLIFLMSEDDQAQLIHDVASVLASTGRFLFSAPVEVGKWHDLNTGIECQSLGEERYRHILSAAGLRVRNSVEDAGRNHFFDTELTGSR